MVVLCHMIDRKTSLALHKRHGAEEAHRAHNPGVVGSKPTAAKYFFHYAGIRLPSVKFVPIKSPLGLKIEMFFWELSAMFSTVNFRLCRDQGVMEELGALPLS